MIDLRKLPNNELSKRVFKERYFSVELNTSRPFLMALIDEEFYYTNDQMEVLGEDLRDYDIAEHDRNLAEGEV